MAHPTKRSVVIDGNKGIYTIDEVLELLRKNGIQVKVVVQRRSSSTTNSKRPPSLKK